MGYHPGLEDDAAYLAAVKNQANPALFPHDAEFFRVQLQATAFDKIVGGSARLTGIPVPWIALFWQFASIFLIVAACRGIAARLFETERARWAGVALTTAMFTLPVSGTALYLVDQHLHPRNVATALILWAVERVLAGRRGQAAALLLPAFFFHPIMAAMGISFSFFLALTTAGPCYSWAQQHWRRADAADGVATGSAAALTPLGWIFDQPTPVWRRALATRRYYFLFQWEWYEWLGALGPLVLFALLWRVAARQGRDLLARFALAVCIYGVFQQAVAMVMLGFPALVRLTPLQPMRYLHLIYFFLTLVGGALLAETLLKSSPWRWAVFLVVVNVGMMVPQCLQYPASEHLELPDRSTSNEWLQAFSWVRQNTPVDAYFAMNPWFMEAKGEDYHGFRALAERSRLADASKDAAVVTQVPSLGPEWERQSGALDGWSHFELADYQRLKRDFGVDWLLLDTPPAGGLDCRWHGRTLTVCRIP